MSKLLYRLGSFAAQRAWAIVGIWALILAALGGSYLAFKGEMSSDITIPGTEAQLVQEELAETFDINANAATGSAILQTEDGSEFTEAQKTALADALAKVAEFDTVDSVSNPFEVAEQMADASTQLDEGRTQLEEGAAELEAGQAELDANRQMLENGEAPESAWAELEAGQAEIDANRAEAEAGAAALTEAQAELDAGRAALDAGQAQLDEGTAALEAGQAQLTESRAALEASGAPADAFAALDAQQAQLDEQRATLEASQAEINTNRAQLDAGQAEIDANRAEVEAGLAALTEAQAQLDEGRAQLENFEPTQEMWDQLTEAQAQLDEGKAELETGSAELERNASLLAMTSDAASISEDGSTAIAGVTFTKELPSLDPEILGDIRAELEGLEAQGLTVTLDQNMQGTDVHFDPTAEIIGIVIAFIILFVMLGTLIAAGLPILMALAGVGASVMGTLALSGVIDMTSTTPMLGTMLGLAVGIDYTLFILNRHRNNLAQGMDIKPSIALATGTSGGAVVFAGITVIIALLGLNVVGIPFLSTMGNAAAFAVFLAVAVSVTLSPALFSLIGWRLISKKRRAALQERAHRAVSGADENEADAALRAEAHAAAEAREEKKTGWIGLVLKKPALTILATVLALGTLAIPVSDMRLGLPDGSSQPTSSASYISYNLIADNFGEGQNGPIIAAARLPEGTEQDAAEALQVEIGEEILAQDHVVSVVPAMVAEDNSAILYQVIPEEGPNSESTAELVHELRALTIATDSGEVNFGVTGQTAMNIDISENLYKVLPIYVGIVIGLSLIVLILVFRSILVPITATIGFLFSLLAAMGATVAVFQWGWAGALFGVSTPGPILSFLPIIAVGILFGLAMDYQLFMVSGMKEAHSHGRGAKNAVVIGYKHGAKVVTAAALIMAGVFIGFVFSGDPMIASIGFILAAGVLFDAFVVRMALIPALMYLLGERAWWIPAWLDRILPDLDVEGTKLEAEIKA